VPSWRWEQRSHRAGGRSHVAGRYPVVGIILLIIFLLGVSLKMHNFWKVADAQAKQIDMINFTFSHWMAASFTHVAVAASRSPDSSATTDASGITAHQPGVSWIRMIADGKIACWNRDSGEQSLVGRMANGRTSAAAARTFRRILHPRIEQKRRSHQDRG
jgi:hypothetical protein